MFMNIKCYGVLVLHDWYELKSTANLLLLQFFFFRHEGLRWKRVDLDNDKDDLDDNNKKKQ